jgi:large repetitive protein
LGNEALAVRLDDLRVAITNLVLQPSSLVYKGQVLAHLDSIIDQLKFDSTMTGMVSQLSNDRSAIAAATTDPTLLAALNNLSSSLDDLVALLDALLHHDVDIFLLPSAQVAQPLTPKQVLVKVHNVGTDVTTYNLAVSGLPPEVTALFSTTSVTLARDGFADVMLTLTQTTTDELLAFDFSVDVSVDGLSPTLTRSAIGSLQTRKEIVSVTSVTVNPPFGNPGSQPFITAQVLNAVNRQRDVVASYVVTNSSGSIVYTSADLALTLRTIQSLSTIEFGFLDTTSFPLGEYTVTVSLTENGQPIPGATHSASLLLGTPVNASLTVTPDVLPPGDSIVTNTLDISLGTATGGNFLGLVGQVAITDGIYSSIARRGNHLYIPGEGGTHIIDISSPSSPFQAAVKGGRATSLAVDGDRLFVIDYGPSTFSPAFARGSMSTYSFTTGAIFPPPSATNPIGIGNLNFGYQLVANPLVIGNTVYAIETTFWWVGNNIIDQTGDVLSFDVTNLSSPQLLDVLMNNYGTAQDAEGIRSGGPFHVFDLAQANANTLLAASTTQTTLNDVTTPGGGMVRIVDNSNPSALLEVGQLAIPNTTFITSVQIVGTRAYLVGSAGGWKDPFPSLDNSGPSGNIVFTTLDITDPRNPSIVGQSILNQDARGAGELVPLGGTRFALASPGLYQQLKEKLYVLDFANPADVEIEAEVSLVDEPRGLTTDGQYLYLTDTAGLKIFSLDVGGTVPIHAEVKIPNGTGVEVVSGSFNIPPTDVVDGVAFDTLVWDFNLIAANPSETITWKTNVSDLHPGEARNVTLDSSVEFTVSASPGELSLLTQSVVSKQVISLGPEVQTAAPGAQTPFTLFIENPTANEVTYFLSVVGVPQEWVNLAPQVTLSAGGFTGINVMLTSGAYTPEGEYGFVVLATADGVTSSVEGLLILQGAPFINDFATAKGVVTELTPLANTAGQGTAANYIVRVTNTGSKSDLFVLFATGLPASFDVTFNSGIFEVLPGAGNYREFIVTIVPPVGTVPGNYPFTVTAASITDVSITGDVPGKLEVLSLGVAVDIIETAGPPQSVFQLVVTNTGAATETFDLAVAAPASLSATLGVSSVTLAPGASQTVPIQVGAIDFAFPGNLSLVAIARSRTNAVVSDQDQADITIAGYKGMTAAFEDDLIVLPTPGPGSFLLMIDNIGNLQDRYVAEIVSMTGPVTASLRDLNGQPATSIPLFILPGLSKGALLLDSVLTNFGSGTVTVRIKSLTDNSIVADAVATVSSSTSALTTTTTVSPTAGTTYGDLFSFQATVSAASGTPTGFVQFKIDSVNVGSPVPLSGGVATFTTSTTLPAGPHTIVAVYAVSEDYIGSQGSFVQQVAKANLTITAANKSKVYGAALPALTVSYGGFVNGDDPTDLTTQPSVSTTATASSNVGFYPITAGGAASSNYNISYVSGTLEVTKANLTITAANKSKVYGAALPALTVNYSGFVNGDDPTDLTTQPSVSTTATASSNVGFYPITASGAASGNYTLSYVSGSLEVTRASLTVTAANKSKVYGAALPSLTVSYSGFVNGDDAGDLTTSLARLKSRRPLSPSPPTTKPKPPAIRCLP